MLGGRRSARSLSGISGLTAGERRWRTVSSALKGAAVGIVAGAALGYAGEKLVGKLSNNYGRGLSSVTDAASKVGASEIGKVADAVAREPVRESHGSIAHGRGFSRRDDYGLTLVPEGGGGVAWKLSTDDLPVAPGKVFSLEQPNGTTAVFVSEHLSEKAARAWAAEHGQDVSARLARYSGKPILRDSIGTDIGFKHGIVVPGPAEGLRVPEALLERGLAEARAASMQRHLLGGGAVTCSKPFSHTGELGKLIEPERLRFVDRSLEYLVDGTWIPWYQMP